MSIIARVTAMLVALLTLIPGSSWGDCGEPPLGYEDYIFDLSQVPVPEIFNVGITHEDGSVIATPVHRDDTQFIIVPDDTRTANGHYHVRYICVGDGWLPVANTKLDLINLASDEEPIRVPITYKVKQGETIASLASRIGMFADSLRSWNITDRKNTDMLYPNERIFVARPAVPLRRWINPGGDKCIIPIEDQIGQMYMMPEGVRDEFHSLITASHPETVKVVSDENNPVVIDGLMYGKGTVWGPTALVWRDRTEMTADRWGPVDWPPHDPVRRYWLYRFHYCNNGAADSEALPRQRAELTVEEVPRPTPEEPTPQPPMVVMHEPEPEPEPELPDAWVQNGAAWLTHEAPMQKGEKVHHNMYFGAIEYVRPSYNGHGLTFVGYASPLNLSGLNRNDHTYAGNYRLGLGVSLLRAGNWGADADAGGYYDMAEVLYDNDRWVTPTHLRRETSGAMLHNFGAYVRPRMYGPKLTYFEGLFRKGQNLDMSVGANLKTEPARLYFEGIYTYTDTRERSRNVDGTIVTMRDALFRTGEGRLGFKPAPNFIVYGSYSQWRFNSDTWWFDHWGPGVGERWKFRKNWTQHFDLKRHTKKDVDPETGKVFRGVEWRPTIGLTYSW